METFRNTFFIVDEDAARRILRVTRTAAPIENLSLVDSVFGVLAGAIRDVPRASYGLLLDIRDGKLRNDEEFEAAMRKNVAPLVAGWRKQATLVRTAVGVLQINRQAREAGNEANVFRDEVEALRFLEAP